MLKRDLRLELLKMSFHPARPMAEVLSNAKQMEEFILEAKEDDCVQEAEKPKAKRRQGNNDPV